MNVICLFVLFRHKCCMSIHVVYTWKSCTWLLCLNNAWHSCLNDTNPWNNIFHTNLEQTHEAYKFVMLYYAFLCRCMEFYMRFQHKHLEIIIRKRAFDAQHSFIVKKMKECNLCHYIYHVEIDELWQGLNYMLVKFGIHYES